MKIFALVLFFIIVPFVSTAEPPANLTANSIMHDSTTGNIEASGDVVVVQGYLILKTDKLIYDAISDTITIPGPLKIYNSIK